MVIAASPNYPRVAAFDFFRRKRHSTIHVMEVIFAGSREGMDGATDLFGFIEDMARMRYMAAADGCQHTQEHHLSYPKPTN